MPAQSIRITLAGDERLMKKLRSLGPRILPGAMKILNQEHEMIMTEAKEQVPVDTGNLKGSGHVSLPQLRGSTVVSEGGFGGPAGGGGTNEEDVGYAIIVHETHKTKSKFYERPFLEAVKGMDARMGAALWVEIRRLARR